MSNKFKNLIKIIIGIVIGGTLFYLAFKDVNWKEFKENLSNINIWLISLGVLIMLLSHLFRGLRWKILLEANNVSVRSSSAFWAVMFGYTVNNAIPRGGEIARCTILKESDNVPISISMGTVVVERAIDMLIMGILLAGVFLVETGTFIEKLTTNIRGAKYLPHFFLAFVLVFGIFAYVVVKYQEKFRKIKLLKPVVNFLVGLAEAILSIRKIDKKFTFIVQTILIWFLYLLSNYVMVLAFPMLPDRSFYFAYLSFIIGAIGIVIPSPGGLGTYHGIIVYLFELLNYSKQLGQLFAFVVHSSIYIPTTIVGGIGYFILIFSKKKELD